MFNSEQLLSHVALLTNKPARYADCSVRARSSVGRALRDMVKVPGSSGLVASQFNFYIGFVGFL